MAKALTAISIANMKPAAARREIADGKSRGLYLVIQPSGHRSWCVRYRTPGTGKPVKLTLGNGGMSLAAARAAAATVWHELSLGHDPAGARETAKAKAATAKANTLCATAEEYLKREGPKLRSIGQRRDAFTRLIYPVLGAKPISEIRRSDVVKLLDTVEDRSGPRMADICLATLSRLFNWHAARDDDFRSPVVRGMGRAKPAAERARDRILSDDELRRVWGAAADIPVFGHFVQFLLLSSARRNEVADMTRAELTPDGVWTLPAERDKAKTGVARPLSTAALAVLHSVPRINDSQFVFSTRGKGAFRSFHEGKCKLD